MSLLCLQVALTQFAGIVVVDKQARRSPFLSSAFEGTMA